MGDSSCMGIRGIRYHPSDSSHLRLDGDVMGSTIQKRVAERMLRGAGFQCVRVRKHEVWAHTDGRTLSLPRSPTKGELRGYLAQKVRTYARGAGLVHHQAGETPP